jgi:SAM-dependent methyltransferase
VFMKTPWKEEIHCRTCGEEKLVHMLDLGTMPPANAFVEKKDLRKKEGAFPLRVAVCDHCLSVQLQDTISPKALFSRDYYYLTGASVPLAKHFEDLGHRLAKEFNLKKKDLVVEMGSNDGVLLGALSRYARVLGVDPASNVSKEAKKRGVPTITDFFGEKVAQKILKKEGSAKLILANNVFAHIPDIHNVIRGIKTLLSEDGEFVAEMHWVGNLLGDGGFDQVYHEHIYYFSLHSLKYLFEIVHGLTIRHVELIPVHGESLRIFVTKGKKVEPSVADFLKKERRQKLHDTKAYLDFSDQVKSVREVLVKKLSTLKQNGKHVVGYGAPAKGNTLLNFCGIGPELLDYIVDTTPTKQGAFTPGTRVPVVHPERLKKDIPDYILLLSWNYADAILKKEKTLRDLGVKFIIPVPRVKIL